MALRLATSPEINHEELRALYAAAWPNDVLPRFDRVLERSLVYVCAYLCDRLVGFVNVAWDGGSHAFLLDPTVHPEFQRQGHLGEGAIYRERTHRKRAALERALAGSFPHRNRCSGRGHQPACPRLDCKSLHAGRREWRV